RALFGRPGGGLDGGQRHALLREPHGAARAIDQRADAHDHAACLLRALHYLARGAAGGDDVLDDQAALARREGEAAAQRHRTGLALREERADAERARHLVGHQDAADRGGQHRCRARVAEWRGQGRAERGGVLRVLEHERRLEIDVRVKAGGQPEVAVHERAGLLVELERLLFGHSSSLRSRLVSTVTPRTSGRGTAKSCAACVAASAAARIIATPPLAWTSSMRTPRRVASRTAPATVFGMSWNLRSRNTRKPRLRAVSTAVGPAAVKSAEPILQPVTMPSRRPSSASASRRLSTSRATRSRSGAATVILLEAQDLLLALEQGLDGADRGLGAVHRQVVGDVLHDGGAADEVRV